MIHSSLLVAVDLTAERIAVTANPDVRASIQAWARERKAVLLALASAKAGRAGRVRLTTDDLAALFAPATDVMPPPDWGYVMRLLTYQPDGWERALAIHALLHRVDYVTMINEARRRSGDDAHERALLTTLVSAEGGA